MTNMNIYEKHINKMQQIESPPARIPMVPEAMQHLSSAINELSNQLSCITDRLTPIMNEIPPTPLDDRKSGAVAVDTRPTLVREITECKERIDNLIELVSSTRSRLEI